MPGSRPDDDVLDDFDEEREQKDAQSFREHFALPDSEQLRASWHCYHQRTLPIHGKLYLGSTHLCWRPFWAKTSKLKLSLKSVETVIKGTSYRLGYSGMCVVISGDEKKFGRALYLATHDERIIKKARFIGEQIRSENGVRTAIDAIYRDFDYARSLIEAKAAKGANFGKDGSMDAGVDMEEEQWTFVDDDNDLDMTKMQQSMLWNAEQGGLVIGPEGMSEMDKIPEQSKGKSRRTD